MGPAAKSQALAAANAQVGAIQPKVILTTDDEVDQWMSAPASETLQLQRSATLRIVARGSREHGRETAFGGRSPSVSFPTS